MDVLLQQIEDFVVDIKKKKNLVSKSLSVAKRLKRYTKSIKKLRKSHKKSKKYLQPLTLEDQANAGLFTEKNIDDAYGDALFTKIVNSVNEFGKGKNKITLRVDQRIMFAHSMGALLPLIYGKTLDANKERLLKMLGLKKIRQELIILAQRRAGKTYFVAMLLAALMIYMPKVEIAVFGLAKRTSAKVMRLVEDMLNKHDACPKFIKNNSEMIKLEGATKDVYKILHAYPDTVHVSIFFYFFILFFYEKRTNTQW